MSRKMAADGRRYPNIRKSGDRMLYIKLFLDYLEAVEPLGDAERGRLFTALLQYARTGEAPHLGGNERFLFPMMRAQIDRDSAEYKDYCEKQAENGKKGGRPKKPKNPPLSGKPTASQKSQDKDKDEDKDKDDDGGYTLARAPAACGSVYFAAGNVRFEPAGRKSFLRRCRRYTGYSPGGAGPRGRSSPR